MEAEAGVKLNDVLRGLPVVRHQRWGANSIHQAALVSAMGGRPMYLRYGGRWGAGKRCKSMRCQAAITRQASQPTQPGCWQVEVGNPRGGSLVFLVVKRSSGWRFG